MGKDCFILKKTLGGEAMAAINRDKMWASLEEQALSGLMLGSELEARAWECFRICVIERANREGRTLPHELKMAFEMRRDSRCNHLELGEKELPADTISTCASKEHVPWDHKIDPWYQLNG